MLIYKFVAFVNFVQKFCNSLVRMIFNYVFFLQVNVDIAVAH